jgi:hypothetical protein
MIANLDLGATNLNSLSRKVLRLVSKERLALTIKLLALGITMLCNRLSMVLTLASLRGISIT